MQRRCSQCRKDLGEVCRQCGSRAPVRHELHLKMPGKDARLQTFAKITSWVCPDCGRQWGDRLDGESLEVCPECEPKIPIV